MIAEALLANGAELHVVLPSDPADFRISSVVAFDATWGARFEAMIDAATSITVAANDSSLTRAAINLADRMAMGMAVETASRFRDQSAGAAYRPERRAGAAGCLALQRSRSGTSGTERNGERAAWQCRTTVR